MKIKYQALLTIDAAMKAVERNGEALQYVLCKELFLSIAKKLNIDTEF